MQFLVMNKKITDKQIAKVAQQSAEYFLICFEGDNLDVISIIEMLTRFCTEHNELAIHIGLLRYCRLYNHYLPQHYIEIVANNDTYDCYCRELTRQLINMTLK